jgi:hypothetical protein
MTGYKQTRDAAGRVTSQYEKMLRNLGDQAIHDGSTHTSKKDKPMTEDQAAATKRLRRKLEILKLDASKVRGQLFHDLQECIALMDIITKGEKDQCK